MSNKDKLKKKGKEELDPIEYDPMRSDYTVQHRAGIAGLLLQLQAMEILLKQAQSDEEKARYIVPEYELTREGRALRIRFTKASFDSLMHERYRGNFVEREYKAKKKEGAGRRFLADKSGNGRFFYDELRPSFDYFEAFSAPKAWQEHTREATWFSYFCIPTTQPASFKVTPEEENKDITVLWNGLISKRPVSLKKNFCLNTWIKGLKGEALTDDPEKVLLLHFWAVASTIFTPTSLKIDRNNQGQLDCETDYHKPVIVVPDVTHAKIFSNEFRLYLKKREHLAASKRRHPDLFISTPREATLSLFFTPHLAQANVIIESLKGARGAEVFTFKSAGQQANVASVINEPLTNYTRDLISDYGHILREVKSYPYRALQIENLLASRKWHDGFDRLADKFPHELFVPPKESSSDSTRRLKDEAKRMARSIRADFKIHTEDEMNEAKPNLERTIYSLTRNYIHWRAQTKKNFSARSFEFDFNKLNALREKRNKAEPLTAGEQSWLRDAQEYVDAVQNVAEELFIRFRGRRDKKSFANLFTETFFRAFYGISADNMKVLGAFVEGSDWESAKRLVLMSISASAAIDTLELDGEESIVDDVADDDQENEEEERQ